MDVCPNQRQVDRVLEALEVKAPMTGRIAAIHVFVGKSVQKGEMVITMEAMKAENLLRAPRKGVIIEILTSEDSTVQAGEILMVLD
jgi:biotin carboxyl carrier protein